MILAALVARAPVAPARGFLDDRGLRRQAVAIHVVATGLERVTGAGIEPHVIAVHLAHAPAVLVRGLFDDYALRQQGVEYRGIASVRGVGRLA